MNITDKQREDAFTKASSDQIMLFDTPASAQSLYAIADKHDLLNEQRQNFLVAIGDVILGLVPQEKLPDLLIERLGITRPEAMKVTADVLDFLAPLSREATASTAQTNSDDLAAEIAETEAALQSAVQPMRTMGQDMATAQGKAAPTPAVPAPKELIHHATGQDSLLANGPGNQTKNPGGSWDTTQSS